MEAPVAGRVGERRGREVKKMGDTGLDPVTSCVSCMTSMFKTPLMDARTAFSGTKMWVFQSATVALHRRHGGVTLTLGGNRH